MEDTVKERLKYYLKSKNIKANVFCNSIGVSSGFISGMRESIQPDKLKSIAINYPDLDITWLLTGFGEMINKSINQSSKGWGNINTASGNVSVEKIVQNDHSVNIALPEKGYQKIINSDGSEMTIEAHSFDMDKITQIEADNKKLREKLKHYDSVLQENSVLKDKIMELQTRLITLLSPKTND